VDTFLKIGDIKGESTDQKHKGEIDVLSWSWGLVGLSRNSPGVPQRPVGPQKEACAQSITLMKVTDVASPLLIANAALGNNIPSATLAFASKRRRVGGLSRRHDERRHHLGHKHQRELRRADGIRNAQLFVRARELQAR